MKRFIPNREQLMKWKERFNDTWEKHGFAVVLLFCAGIIGVTAFLSSRIGGQEEELPTPPAVSYAARSTEAVRQAAVATPSPSVTPEPTARGMDWPARGDIQTGYHADTLVYNETLGEYSTHSAIDIAMPGGGDITVPMDGVVEDAYADPSLGNVVIIRHENGLRTGYASLASLDGIRGGMAARRGMILGQAGVTAICELSQGPHLHFFVLDEAGNPIDPMTLLPSGHASALYGGYARASALYGGYAYPP